MREYLNLNNSFDSITKQMELDKNSFETFHRLTIYVPFLDCILTHTILFMFESVMYFNILRNKLKNTKNIQIFWNFSLTYLSSLAKPFWEIKNYKIKSFFINNKIFLYYTRFPFSLVLLSYILRNVQSIYKTSLQISWTPGM